MPITTSLSATVAEEQTEALRYFDLPPSNLLSALMRRLIELDRSQQQRPWPVVRVHWAAARGRAAARLQRNDAREGVAILGMVGPTYRAY
jgi:hypothetical protein